MGELGEFLERFFSPEPTFRTVRATIGHTTKAADGGSSARRRVIGRRKPDAKSRDGRIETLLMWAIPPNRVRVETERIKDGRIENTVEVANGDSRWKRFADGTVQREEISNPGANPRDSLPTAYQRHFDGRLIRECFAALTLEPIGNVQAAGRRCLRIRAVLTRDGQIWPHWLAWHADEFEFAADVERAVLLSISGIVAGKTTERHAVLEVAFDEELEESLFTYQSRQEETVQPATPVVERMTLEAAAARAPFTVLRPTWLPESDRLQCHSMYHPSRPDCPDEHVSLHYHGGASFSHLSIRERSEREKQSQTDLLWDVVSFRRRSLEVSDPSPEEGMRVVMFEQAGTWVEMVSDMDIEQLLQLAVSFEPAAG